MSDPSRCTSPGKAPALCEHLAAADIDDPKSRPVYLVCSEYARAELQREREGRAKAEVRIINAKAEQAAVEQRLREVEGERDALSRQHYDEWVRAGAAEHDRDVYKAKRDSARSELAALRERMRALPDDLRAAGWSVAVHNDYRINGESHTFWLFTHPDGRYAKGEGRTDAEALDQVRTALSSEKP